MNKFAKPRKQIASLSLTKSRAKTFIVVCVFFLQCFVFFSASLFAQTASGNPDLEQLLEFFAISANVSPNLDAIEYYSRYPLQLRTITVRDLEGFAVFSQEMSERIVRFLQKHPSSNLKMLQDSLNVSDIQILLLKVCTRLNKPSSTEQGIDALKLWYRARSRFWAIPQRGFTSDATPAQQYQGTSLDVYQRLTLRFDTPVQSFLPEGTYEANVTAAKDAGERFLTDFLSGYMRLALRKTNIVFGDFLVESGMGTHLWSIYGNVKSADVITPTTQQQFRIIPYRSSTEQQFFRGIAAQTSFTLPISLPTQISSDSLNVNILSWYSSQSRAARIDTTRRDTNIDVATSLNFDGLFRTKSEISLLDGLWERIGGVGVEISGTNEKKTTSWSLGGTVLLLDYDKPIVSRSSQVFLGKSGINAGVFGSLSFENILTNTELSIDAEGNIGGRINAEFSSKPLEIATSLRVFPTDFRAPFGANFGEARKPSNESGLYVGAIWKGWENIRINSYVDIYSTLSSTATIPIPVRGVDIFTETTWQIGSQLVAIIRARHETKTDALTQGTGRMAKRVIYGRGKSSLRLHSQYDISPEIRLQSRIEGVIINSGNAKPVETGVLGFIGVQWRPLDAFSATMRVVGYSTDSFDSALWQYEQTVAGTLSNPALYGQGLRAYCLIEGNIFPQCTLSARGSITRRFDVTSFGSGSTLVNSNTDAQLVVQVDVHF